MPFRVDERNRISSCMTLLDYYTLDRDEKQAWDLPSLERAVLAEDPTFLVRVSELVPGAGERFRGDLVDLDLGPLFQKLTQLCQLYQQATPAQRTLLRSGVTPKTAGKLESFALRAAVAGARARAPASVQLGLTALALADLGTDVREVMMSLAVMLRCCQHSGGDPRGMFGEAAAAAGPAMSAVLLDFAARPPALQALGLMGWAEVATPAGPGYRFGPRKS